MKTRRRKSQKRSGSQPTLHRRKSRPAPSGSKCKLSRRSCGTRTSPGEHPLLATAVQLLAQLWRQTDPTPMPNPSLLKHLSSNSKACCSKHDCYMIRARVTVPNINVPINANAKHTMKNITCRTRECRHGDTQ